MRLLFLVIVLLAVQPQMARADSEDTQKAAAARAAECEVDTDWPFGVALGRVPGQSDPGLSAVATVSGDADGKTLGELCVALVRGKSGRFTRVASLGGAPIMPPSEVDPVTNVYVDVSKTPFRFMSGEVAFGVEASGEYNSEATNLSFSTLYLFRRIGDRIVPIFHAKTRGMLIDKTDPKDNGTDRRWIIRFDTVQHRGAFDLVLQRYHGKDRRRYVWQGSRYVPSKAAA